MKTLQELKECWEKEKLQTQKNKKLASLLRKKLIIWSPLSLICSFFLILIPFWAGTYFLFTGGLLGLGAWAILKWKIQPNLGQEELRKRKEFEVALRSRLKAANPPNLPRFYGSSTRDSFEEDILSYLLHGGILGRRYPTSSLQNMILKTVTVVQNHLYLVVQKETNQKIVSYTL